MPIDLFDNICNIWQYLRLQQVKKEGGRPTHHVKVANTSNRVLILHTFYFLLDDKAGF